MKLIGFRDFDWSSRGFRANIPSDAKPYISIAPTVLYRAGAPPAFGPSQFAERSIPCEFSWRGDQFASYEEAWNWLMNRLNIYDTRPGELRAERLNGVTVKLEAILTLPNASVFGGVADITTLPAIFISGDPLWTALSPATESKVFSASYDRALAVPIDSSIADPPIITITPTVQRAAGTADVGWTKRQVLRVTNNLATALINVPYALDLGDTAALVTAGKALASGNDLRIIRDGREVARTLDDWNTASSRAWITIANLAAGASFDVEVWYGNSAAGAPLTHDDLNEPALDMDTSTNLIWKYAINPVAANAGEGGWNLSSGTQVPNISTDAPAAWRFAMTLSSPDDTWQDRYTSFVDTSTYYRAIFAAQRARAASLPALPQYVDADGVMLHHPAGITQVRCDLQWLNEYKKGSSGNPVGKVVILSSQDGQVWTTVQSWSTAQTTLADVATANYAISPAAPYVAFAVWPFDSSRVPTTAASGRRVAANWKSALEITVGGASIAQSTVSAEETIYELATELRLGGDDDLDAPYRALRIGGASDRRFAIALDQHVKIDLGERSAVVRNAADTATLSNVPVYAIAAVERISEAASEQAAGRWLDMQPYTNPLENPSFDVDVDGWSQVNVAGTVTAAALAIDANRIRARITASTLGSGQVALRQQNDEYLLVNGKAQIRLAADLRTADATKLEPVLSLWFYDEAQALIGSPYDADTITPASNTTYRRVFAVTPPAGAVYYRVGYAVETIAANATGDVFADEFQPEGLDLIVTDTAIGTMTVAVSWLTQYL